MHRDASAQKLLLLAPWHWRKQCPWPSRAEVFCAAFFKKAAASFTLSKPLDCAYIRRMSAESDQLNEQIGRSVALLRRHL
jgi:hypothetical protein